MDEHTLSLLSRHVNEVVNLVCNPVLLVKQYLVLMILPVEGQIDDADVLPKILYLLAGAIDYMRYLVRHDKLQVLKS